MKYAVLDTNVILSDPKSIFNFPDRQIVLPLVVIEELDKIKTRFDGVGFNARTACKLIDQAFQDKKLTIMPGFCSSPDKINDDIIISCAHHFKANGVILVSNDLNVRLKAGAWGIPTQSLDTANKETYGLYKGYREFDVDDDVIDKFYKGHPYNAFIDEDLNMNEYVILKSRSNPKRRAFARYMGERWKPLRPVKNDDVNLWTIKPANFEQVLAADALLDPDIPVVTLIGVAGSGKTLLATAAGIQQVFGKMGSEKLYKKLIISRPIQVMGNDIGFLPGSAEEKLAPWTQPIIDNLEVLTENKPAMVAEWFEKGKIEVEALPYIRGRSINNAIMIVDEAQNLTSHEVKTILTRVGHNTKIILTGDIEQIDNAKITQMTNGLTYAVEKLKNSDITAHITLEKSERSKVAEVCAKLL